MHDFVIDSFLMNVHLCFDWFILYTAALHSI